MGRERSLELDAPAPRGHVGGDLGRDPSVQDALPSDSEDDDDENRQLQVFETNAVPDMIPEPGWVATGGVCVLCSCQAQLTDDCPACWPAQLQRSRL